MNLKQISPRRTRRKIINEEKHTEVNNRYAAKVASDGSFLYLKIFPALVFLRVLRVLRGEKVFFSR